MDVHRVLLASFTIALLVLAFYALAASEMVRPVWELLGNVSQWGILGFAFAAAVFYAPIVIGLNFDTLRKEGLPGKPGKEPAKFLRKVEPLGLCVTTAFFFLAVMRSLDKPAGWHDAAADWFATSVRLETGVTELASITMSLAPLVACTMLLQLCADVPRATGSGNEQESTGRNWVWIAWLAVLLGCAAFAFVIARG